MKMEENDLSDDAETLTADSDSSMEYCPSAGPSFPLTPSEIGTAPFEQVLMEEVRADVSGMLDESDADPLLDHFAMHGYSGES